MTATAIVLALALMTSPIDAAVSAVDGGNCGSYSSRVTPPRHILVFRLHRRGSSIPARVERWGFRKYVSAVMASGAWPGRVRESAKVGSIMIRQWAWWMVLHHQPGYSWRGQCYSIRDSDQYLAPHVRPWTRVPRKTSSAVRAVWDVSLRKNGKFLRLGWSGGGGRCGQVVDGYHVGEDGVRDCAERLGFGWRRILHIYLDPRLTIVRP